jgi:uncharacterized membrane protein
MSFLMQIYSFIAKKLLVFAFNVDQTFCLAIGIEVYSYETLGKIAAVATFRTLLAYFLAKDYREKTNAGQEKAL